MRNLNSIKLEIIEIFQPKLAKFLSKLKLKLEKFINLNLNMCLNSNILNSIKLEFEKSKLVQALLKHQTLPLNVHTSEGFKSDLNFMKI